MLINVNSEETKGFSRRVCETLGLHADTVCNTFSQFVITESISSPKT